MPSRRDVLSSIAGGGVVATAGCLGSATDPRVGRIPQEQRVTVGRNVDGRPREWTVAVARAPDPPRAVLGVAEEFAGIADERGNVSVDEATARELSNTFDTVRYSVTLCRDGSTCRGGRTSRENLDRITFDSEVRASLLRNRWRVFSVDAPDETREWAVRREEFSIEDSGAWPGRHRG